MPLRVFELEDTRGQDDGKEHVEDGVGTDGCLGEGRNGDGVHEPRLEHLETCLRIPRRLHAIAI